MGSFGKDSSKSQDQSYTPEQKKYLTKALDIYGNQLGKNDNVWEGDRVAGFGDLQSNVLGSASGALQSFSGDQSVGTPMFGQTGDAIGKLLSGDIGASKITQDQTDQHFRETTYDPTMRMLKDDILPTVDEGYAGGNFFGSARGKARDEVSTDVANTLVSQKAGLDWNVLQNNQQIDESKANRTLQTVPQAMQYGQMPAQETLNNLRIASSQVEGMRDLFGVGQQEQTQQQRELEAQIAQFAEQNQITDPENLSILLSLLDMNYSSGSSKSSGFSVGINSPKSG